MSVGPTTMEFSVTSSDSLWQSQRLKKNVPFILSISSSVLLAIFAVLLKFTGIFPVTYRVVECNDILGYQETSNGAAWFDIDDEYFAVSITAFSMLLVSRMLVIRPSGN